MIAASRRSILTGLVAMVAAPAIVRAGSLMPVNSKLVPGNTYLTIHRIAHGAVGLFKDCNAFIAELNKYEYKPNETAQLNVLYGAKGFVGGEQWSSEQCRALMERQAEINGVWATDDTKIGDVLRIRLPNDYIMSDGPELSLQEPVDSLVARRYYVPYDEAVRRWPDPMPQIPDSLTLAAAAVAVAPVVLAKPVTRRFWAK